jgi:hypothetical protein
MSVLRFISRVGGNAGGWLWRKGAALARLLWEQVGRPAAEAAAEEAATQATSFIREYVRGAFSSSGAHRLASDHARQPILASLSN